MPPKKSTSSNAFVAVFVGLNAALYLHTRAARAIPSHVVISSIIALILCILVATFRHDVYPQSTLEKSVSFKKYVPILLLSECSIFLVIPWVLLVTFRGTPAWRVLVPVLSSHLYIIQTQIGLESIFMSRKRHGALFLFIVISNFYRGVAVVNWITNFIDMRKGLLSDTSSSHLVTFMAVYTIAATLVYISAIIITAFVWYPCLKLRDDSMRAHKS